eukprot:7742-Heterococcus_DN1.PRE.7
MYNSSGSSSSDSGGCGTAVQQESQQVCTVLEPLCSGGRDNSSKVVLSGNINNSSSSCASLLVAVLAAIEQIGAVVHAAVIHTSTKYYNGDAVEHLGYYCAMYNSSKCIAQCDDPHTHTSEYSKEVDDCTEVPLEPLLVRAKQVLEAEVVHAAHSHHLAGSSVEGELWDALLVQLSVVEHV